nr:unnamed protein product [Callosobruchus analis]
MPASAMDTALHSVSSATLAQYNCTYKLWWKFCSRQKILPFQANTENVIIFLQELVNSNRYKYGTINSHRSALCLILPDQTMSNPLLVRFLKGVARLRLAKPKYNYTWDPGLVLKYFETSTKDDLLFLSKKVAMLLALVTGHRIQTISLIKMINIIESTSGFQILIPDRIKSSGVNKIQPCLNIPFYPTCAKVCPASALKCYIDRTKDIRKNNSDLLFISPRKPHAPVTKQTLSRWLKDVMLLAGVDAGIFTSHSTRHASTSAALRKGLSVDNIQRIAGWTSESSVFARFYNRPLTSTSFAYSVLK